MRQDFRVIVEGMDGAGKTTLIDKLKYDFPHQFEVIRNDLGPDQDFATWWPEQLERPKSSVVPLHDRFYFSEIVYGTVIRKKLAASQELMDNVAWFLRSLALVIYVRPHSEIIRKTVHDNAQMDGVLPHFESLLRLYDGVMAIEQEWFKDRFVRYDWNNPKSYPEVEQTVRRYLAGGMYHTSETPT